GVRHQARWVRGELSRGRAAQPPRGRPDGQGRRVPLPQEQDHLVPGPRHAQGQERRGGEGRLRHRDPGSARRHPRDRLRAAVRAVILGTGSEPKSLPGVTIDEKTVISSNGAVRNEQHPKSIAVIGAGAVGVEFADVFASYGVRVTILEALPRVVPVEDEEVSKELARTFARRGITIKTGVKVTSVKPGGAGVVVDLGGEKLEVERVLMAVGPAAEG